MDNIVLLKVKAMEKVGEILMLFDKLKKEAEKEKRYEDKEDLENIESVFEDTGEFLDAI